MSRTNQAPAWGPARGQRRSGLAVAVLGLLAAACLGPSAESEPRPSGPEAPGPRPPARLQRWRYVALGDSIPGGAGAGVGYPRLYADFIERDTGASVALRNLAAGGSTTADLLRRVERDATLRQAVRDADVVTITVGGNDLSPRHSACGWDVSCYRRSLPSLLARWDELLGQVLALRGGRPGIVRATNYYDPLPGNPWVSAFLGPGGRGRLGEARDLVREHTSGLCEMSARHGIPCADVYGAFHGADGDGNAFASGLMSSDGLHPSSRGQRRIAEALRALGYAPLA